MPEKKIYRRAAISYQKQVTPKPGQLQYLLHEIYDEMARHKPLFQSLFYRDLLALRVPWPALFAEIENLGYPAIRQTLRKLEAAYTRDYIVQEMSFLELNSREDHQVLENAIYLLALIHDPMLTKEKHHSFFDEFEQAVSHRLRENDLPVETLAALLREENANVLERSKALRQMQQLRIHINEVVQTKYRPRNRRNSFFNPLAHFPHTLADKNQESIPLSMSILYLDVFLRMGLPVFGVNLPRHFIIKLEAPWIEIFMDPYNGGAFVDRKALVQQVKAHGISFRSGFLNPCNFEIILKRMTANLISLYTHLKEDDNVIFLKSLGYSELY